MALQNWGLTRPFTACYRLLTFTTLSDDGLLKTTTVDTHCVDDHPKIVLVFTGTFSTQFSYSAFCAYTSSRRHSSRRQHLSAALRQVVITSLGRNIYIILLLSVKDRIREPLYHHAVRRRDHTVEETTFTRRQTQRSPEGEEGLKNSYPRRIAAALCDELQSQSVQDSITLWYVNYRRVVSY
jgi:hypothetical protein